MSNWKSFLQVNIFLLAESLKPHTTKLKMQLSIKKLIEFAHSACNSVLTLIRRSDEGCPGLPWGSLTYFTPTECEGLWGALIYYRPN